MQVVALLAASSAQDLLPDVLQRCLAADQLASLSDHAALALLSACAQQASTANAEAVLSALEAASR